MTEYGFTLTRLFPYKDRIFDSFLQFLITIAKNLPSYLNLSSYLIFDSVFIRKYTCQRKPVLRHILRTEYLQKSLFSATILRIKILDQK